eukprot:CAMPEP_0174376658 /NCGR_PEP_ID=MMETSP0811_2-20130205/118967_1 /TAXON_ID=73025 ORGANISM="Eutreptiella gymnastica-like, Strain CCMP1594" /NCGR_SAMPLE_ID=MMETSP0811_2 /ASSEMBLY_ACC=CAM_ASM_000667 /LENGTH=61 /DNA_ID=CAMNT_0015528047 /DNA_START=1277 /DNA_END=1459 /DNA_ORIENTATION=-
MSSPNRASWPLWLQLRRECTITGRMRPTAPPWPPLTPTGCTGVGRRRNGGLKCGCQSGCWW